MSRNALQSCSAAPSLRGTTVPPISNRKQQAYSQNALSLTVYHNAAPCFHACPRAALHVLAAMGSQCRVSIHEHRACQTPCLGSDDICLPKTSYCFSKRISQTTRTTIKSPRFSTSTSKALFDNVKHAKIIEGFLSNRTPTVGVSNLRGEKFNLHNNGTPQGSVWSHRCSSTPPRHACPRKERPSRCSCDAW